MTSDVSSDVITIVRGRFGSSLSRASSSRPFMPGIHTSVKSKSNPPSRTFFRAALPSTATETSYPASPSTLFNIWRVARSSSATKIFFIIFSFALAEDRSFDHAFSPYPDRPQFQQLTFGNRRVYPQTARESYWLPQFFRYDPSPRLCGPLPRSRWRPASLPILGGHGPLAPGPRHPVPRSPCEWRTFALGCPPEISWLLPREPWDFHPRA